MSVLLLLALAALAAWLVLRRRGLSLRTAALVRGKTVVVVGASSGIGRAMAEDCARLGCARLVLSARRAENLSAVARRCVDLGCKEVQSVPCDLCSPTSPSAIVSAAGTSIDVLLVLSGVTMDFAAFDDQQQTAETAEKILDVNYRAPVALVREAMPLIRMCSGRILVVSSMSAFIPRPRRTFYAAAKAAVFAFFDNLRFEVARDGVSVTLGLPGFVSTEMSAGVSRLKASGESFSPRGQGEPDSEMDTGGAKKFGISLMSAEKCARMLLVATMNRSRRAVVPWWYCLILSVWLAFPKLYEKFVCARDTLPDDKKIL